MCCRNEPLGREAGRFRGLAAAGGRGRRSRERMQTALEEPFGREAGRFRGLAAAGGRGRRSRERMQTALEAV